MVGSDSQAGILFQQLIEVFQGAKWATQTAQIATVTVVGANFPHNPYLTAPDLAKPAVEAVFSALSEWGVNLPITPNAYMGPGSMGPPPDVVIVIQ